MSIEKLSLISLFCFMVFTVIRKFLPRVELFKLLQYSSLGVLAFTVVFIHACNTFTPEDLSRFGITVRLEVVEENIGDGSMYLSSGDALGRGTFTCHLPCKLEELSSWIGSQTKYIYLYIQEGDNIKFSMQLERGITSEEVYNMYEHWKETGVLQIVTVRYQLAFLYLD